MCCVKNRGTNNIKTTTHKHKQQGTIKRTRFKQTQKKKKYIINYNIYNNKLIPI